MKVTIVAAALLFQIPATYNVSPNLFEPGEKSSEFIYLSMMTCFQAEERPEVNRLVLCGCLVDAERFNARHRKPNTIPTAEQRKTCMDAAGKRAKMPQRDGGPAPAKKGKTGT